MNFETLATIEHDVLLLWGREDRFCSLDEAFIYLELLRNANLLLFRDTGHWVQIERRAEFAAHVSAFLGLGGDQPWPASMTQRAPACVASHAGRGAPRCSGCRSRMSTFLQYLFNGLTIGAVYALVGVGLTLGIGVARFFNFAQGQLAVLAAFVAMALTQAGLPFYAALALSLLVVALVGVGIRGVVVPFAGRDSLVIFSGHLGHRLHHCRRECADLGCGAAIDRLALAGPDGDRRSE